MSNKTITLDCSSGLPDTLELQTIIEKPELGVQLEVRPGLFGHPRTMYLTPKNVRLVAAFLCEYLLTVPHDE